MPQKVQDAAKSGKKRWGLFHRKKADPAPAVPAATAAAPAIGNSAMANLLGASSVGSPGLDQAMQARTAGLARRRAAPVLNLDLNQPITGAPAPAQAAAPEPAAALAQAAAPEQAATPVQTVAPAQAAAPEQTAAPAEVQAPRSEESGSDSNQPVKQFLLELMDAPTPIRVEGQAPSPQEEAPPAADSSPAPALSPADEDAFLKADPQAEVAAAAEAQAVSPPSAMKKEAAVEEKIEAAVPAASEEAEGSSDAATAAAATTTSLPELEDVVSDPAAAAATTTTTAASPEPEEAEADTAAAITTTSQVAADEAAEGSAQEDPVQKGTQRFSSFVRLHDQLIHSKKGGIGSNSSLFLSVSSCTEAVIKAVNEPLPGDPQGNQAAMDHLRSVYKDLIISCKLYTTHRKPKTSNGKARKDIVAHIREQAEKDFARLLRVFDRIPKLPPQEQPKSLLEVLGMARTREITLKNGPIGSLKQYGDAISKLYQVKPGDAADGDVSGFFKQAMTLHPTSLEWSPDMTDEEREKLDYSHAVRALVQRNPEYEEYGDFLMGRLKSTANPGSMYAHQPTRDAKLFDLALLRATNQMSAARDLLDNYLNTTAGTKPQIATGITNRNVATSRLANALGIGDVVVQSELATLKGSDNSSMSGILMQEAPGRSMEDELDEVFREEAIDSANPSTILYHPHTRVSGIQRLFSPQFLHMLTNLQVLDSLTGQVDRHTGNYFVEHTPSGQIGAVHGIDNEMAFGLDTFRSVGALESPLDPNRMGDKGFNFLTPQGEIRLPYMDKQLADRIMALTPEDLQLLLGDVLEKPYLDALCTRVQEAQAAIARDREEDPTGQRYLEREDQWDASVMAALVSPPSGKRVSYVGDLVLAAEKGMAPLPAVGRPTIVKIAEQYRTEEQAKIWVSLKGEKDKVARLKALNAPNLIGDDVIQYMTAHQDDFQYTAEEVQEPDVQNILYSLTCCDYSAVRRFKEEQQRRLAAKQKATP